ncbi:MAG: ComF family protein [Desulfovibrio sp.]|nr:ComF family protein [Desulfovibrio sp.]
MRAIARALGLDERRCAHCLAPFSPEDAHADAFFPLCPSCEKELRPFSGPRCRLCALPLPGAKKGDAGHAYCPDCRGTIRPWQGIACYGLYQGALRDAILRLKFDGETAQAPFLAACLIEAAACLPRPDAVVPMPLHPSRLRERGFNQVHEMTRRLCSATGLQALPALLSRTKAGIAQEKLSADERSRNLRGSFAASARASGRTLWLVDDVMTTGSTLDAACEALRQAGATAVHVLLAARTPLAARRTSP